MLELHDPRSDTTKRFNWGKSKITKFAVQTLDENGRARNYDFDPEYDLILYVYSNTNKSFKEYKVQYGYMYEDTPGTIYCFPVFREIPTDDNRKINVWKISSGEWNENEVIRVSSNFYAYSLPENRDLNKFLDGAMKVIENQKKKLTDKYNSDIHNQDKLHDDIIEILTKVMYE